MCRLSPHGSLAGRPRAPHELACLRGQADDDVARAQVLAVRLERELGREHSVRRAGWQVVAQSNGRDDVLLAPADGTAAIGHLTYSSQLPRSRHGWATIILATPDELDDEFLMRD
jgi:hypothetical protein